MAFNDTISDLRNLNSEDLSRLGTAPLALRILLMIVLAALVITGMTHYMTIPQFDKHVALQNKEQSLRLKFDSEQAKAANRAAYVEQLEDMKKTFNVMLRQLPNKTDIESLLVDLSQTSVASGLDVEYFKPESEVPREFYAEYPIKISVTGQYHQFGQFISGLASLPRIVTLNKIDVSQLVAKGGRDQLEKAEQGRLKMDLVATTYRYLEEE